MTTELNPCDLEYAYTQLLSTLLNVDTYHNHIVAGTLEQYYMASMTNFIHTLLMTPINRSLAGIDTTEDPDNVAEVVDQAVLLLSNTFNKDPVAVEAIMTDCIKSLPIDDLREAKILRHRGQLN